MKPPPSSSASASPPSSPTNGTLWWNSDYGRLLVYYTDANGKLSVCDWLQVTPDAADAEGKWIHLHLAEYETSNSGEYSSKKKQNGLYFVDPSLQQEGVDTKRVGSITYFKYADAGQLDGAIGFSPWDNYNDNNFGSSSQLLQEVCAAFAEY